MRIIKHPSKMGSGKPLIVSLLFVFVINALSFQVDYEFSPLDIETLETFKAFADEVPKSEDPKEASRKLVLNYMKNNNIPGIAVAIIKNGTLQWSEGFGLMDLENKVPTHKDAVWRLASISKSLTSNLIAHLVEDGLLDLDKPINSFIPTKVLPSKTWQKKPVTVTLRQLMSHTAWFRMTLLDDVKHKVFESRNLSESVKQFKDVPLLFEPGKNFSYSNYGYQVVGMAIEQVLAKKGMTYEQAINKMFRRLGMMTTQAERRGKLVPRRTRYYTQINLANFSDVSIKNTDIFDDLLVLEGWWPAGGIMSSASDLVKFGSEMLKSYKGNGLLKKQTVEELWKPVVHDAFGIKNLDYGLGWVSLNFTKTGADKILNLTRMYGHSGGLLGTSTQLGVFPDQDIVAAVFSNLGLSRHLDALMIYIAKNFV